jgi:hypothetical protein
MRAERKKRHDRQRLGSLAVVSGSMQHQTARAPPPLCRKIINILQRVDYTQLSDPSGGSATQIGDNPQIFVEIARLVDVAADGAANVADPVHDNGHSG